MSSLYRWMPGATGLMLVLGLVLLGGCGSSQTTSSTAGEGGTAEAASEEEVADYDPQVGMNKDEILEMYQGKPDHRSLSSDGTEVWRYHVNAGEAWIPFNFGYRPRFHEIYFNDEGVVERYVTD